jgi:FeS assembly SUF system regulator
MSPFLAEVDIGGGGFYTIGEYKTILVQYWKEAVMLRVTKLADYGIVILTYLAGKGAPTANARDVARQVRLPQPVVSKILKLLARDGLLESRRGIKGGYCLSLRPEEITVARIISALEGPIAVTECTDNVHGDCGLETGCPVRTNWHKINGAIHRALETITLADMTQPLRKPRLRFAELIHAGPFHILGQG